MQVSPYVHNKAVSLGFPLLFLVSLLPFFSSDDPQLWWILIVATHTLGYMHFILGYIYQARALIKKQNNRHLVIFFVLTAIAVGVSVAFIQVGLLAALAVIAVVYFIVHGTLNEVTMMEQQIGEAPPRSIMLPFVLYITPFFLLSLTHPSFFFSPKLDFLNPPPQVAVRYLDSLISVELIGAIAFLMIVLFVILVPVRLICWSLWLPGLAILSVVAVSIPVFLTQAPLNYVFLYFIALSYHFISWSYYYGQIYVEKAPKRLWTYCLHHAYVLVPLVLVSGLVFFNSSESVYFAHHWLYDGRIFIMMAMIHNTTSFLNETWFVRLIKA